MMVAKVVMVYFHISLLFVCIYSIGGEKYYEDKTFKDSVGEVILSILWPLIIVFILTVLIEEFLRVVGVLEPYDG